MSTPATDEPSTTATPTSEKASVEHAVSQLLARHGYEQALGRLPMWTFVADLAKKLGLKKATSEPRLAFKRRLLSHVDTLPSSSSVADSPAATPAAASSNVPGSPESPSLSSFTSRVAADVILPDGWRSTVPSLDDLVGKSHAELERSIRSLYQLVKIPQSKLEKATLYRQLKFKLMVDPSVVRETLTSHSTRGKTERQVLHGNHFASVDKFDQYLSSIRTKDRVRKKMVRVFRWITEASVVQVHSLIAESTFTRARENPPIAATLQEIKADFDCEQAQLSAIFLQQ